MDPKPITPIETALTAFCTERIEALEDLLGQYARVIAKARPSDEVSNRRLMTMLDTYRAQQISVKASLNAYRDMLHAIEQITETNKKRY